MKHTANIVLDLDQTIISSEYLNKFKDATKSPHVSRLKSVKMMGEFIIFERPHLQEFLDFVFNNFNVSVWTAASRDYGLYIIEKFILTKPQRQIDFFFYSYHCNFCIKLENKLKPLSILWDGFGLMNYNKKNTIIIDDNADVYKSQPKNTYQIKQFDHTDSNCVKDTELLTLIKVLRKIFTK